MRRYEVVFVLAPTLTEEETQAQIDLFSAAAEEMGANVLEKDLWGKRRLAFPVKKFSDGFYVILTLEEPAATAVTELERRFRVSDAVIRYLTIRIDEDLKRAEKFKARREAKKAQREPSPKRAAQKPAPEPAEKKPAPEAAEKKSAPEPANEAAEDESGEEE